MMKPRTYIGDLSNDIQNFLNSVVASKSYKTHLSQHMKILDNTCLAINHSSSLLDEELIMFMFPRKIDEKLQSWKQRNCSFRKFAYYLHSIGKPAFVSPPCITQKVHIKETTFESDLSLWMQNLIEYKRSLGYKYQNERKFLKQFDTFLVKKGYTGIDLTQQMVMAWEIRQKGESEKTRANKTSVVRILGLFMGSNCGKAYISPYTLSPEKSIPYVFSETTLITFFHALDNYKFPRHWMGLVYPVYYRLLYATGLRESEACSIERLNLDFDAKRILILNAKGNKDRYVYFADDIFEMLYRYDKMMDSFFPCRKWLFVGAYSPHVMLSPNSVRSFFSMFWKVSGMKTPSGLNNRPCTHSFRYHNLS